MAHSSASLNNEKQVNVVLILKSRCLAALYLVYVLTLHTLNYNDVFCNAFTYRVFNNFLLNVFHNLRITCNSRNA